MVGMVDSPHELFLARGAEHVANPCSDAEEAARIEWIPLADITEMVKRDEFIGAGTLVALLYAAATMDLANKA
jgi:hypothetical protein